MAIPTKPDNLPDDMTAPQRGDPKLQFANDMNTFLFRLVDEYTPSLNLLADWMNLVGSEIETIASEVEADANAAANAQTAAEGFRDEAEGFKDSAEAAAIAAQAGAGLPSGGSVGDVLTLLDAGTNAVAFQAPVKSGLVPLLTVNASGDTAIDFTGLDAYGYSNYVIDYDLTLDSGVIENLIATVSTDNGASFDAVGAGVYGTIEQKVQFESPSTTNSSFNFSDTSVLAGILYSANSQYSRIHVSGLLSGYTTFVSNRMDNETIANRIYAVSSAAIRKSAQIDNAIRLSLSTNTMSGTLTLYGVAEA